MRYKNVSNQHCEFELKEGYWHVRDLGSSNGVKVNGVRVDSKCLLPGDEVMISKHAFHIEYVVDADSAPPQDDNPFDMSLMEKAGLEVRRSQEDAAPAARKSSSKSSGSNADDFLMEWLSDE